MKIRKIKEKDFNEWLDMRYGLWGYHTKEHLRKEMIEIYKDRVQKPIYVAINDNEICGFIELSIRDQAPGCTTKEIGFIEGWYVKTEYRRLGIGRLLVEACENWARSIGCKEMASDTTERYKISPVAHLALGYEETKVPLHYRKIL